MLKVSLALLTVTFGMVLPAIATSTPANLESQFDDGDQFCFMQTREGNLLNLDFLCGSNVHNGDSIARRPVVSSSLGGLEAYRRPANMPQCFVFDAQGQPCPPAQ